MNQKKPKPKKCKSCGSPFNPRSSLQQVCSHLCAVSYSKEVRLKKEKREWIQERKVLKSKLKTLGEYKSEAREWFQKWIRWRDRELPCISCNNDRSSRYDGGHWWKAEIFSGLIFHEDNCHKQCSRPCNKDLNGDQANYRIGLVKRIGLERVVWLEENKDRLRVYEYTKQELIEIRDKYKQKLKEAQ